MAKNFPYFKFIVSEWMTGDIVFESLSVQGLFINICALYWQRDGSLSVADVNKRYKNPDELKNLVDRFIHIENEFIAIKFLDEQLIDAGHISKINSDKGKKSALKRAEFKQQLNNGSTTVQQRFNRFQQRKEEEKKKKKKIRRKEEEEEEEKKNEIKIEDVKLYFFENGYTDLSAQRFFDYYSVANWKDSKGNKVKNWKQKAQAVWFKPDNKIVDNSNKMVY